MNIRKLSTLLFMICAFGARAYAQEETYNYEPVSIEKLSQFYWTLNKMDINNDLQIDNFLRINECDIYNDYYHNEFEWKKVRDSGRKFIEQNKGTFPVRFEFTQPLRLTDYDFKTGMFGILGKYQISGVRRFEVYANDYYANICGTELEIESYPRGLAIETNRPLTLTQIKVTPDIAEKFIASKTAKFKELDDDRETKEELYETRDAYMVLKIHGYSYTGPFRADKGMQLAGALATLEGIEVYGDKEKTLLLYSENFLKKRELSDMEKKLMEEYEATKKNVEAAPAEVPAP